VSALSGFDLLALIVVGVSALLGFVRGLTFEVLSLVAWVAAYVLSMSFSSNLAPHLPVGAPGSGLNQSVAVVVTFILVLVAVGLLARLMRFLVAKTPLVALDRVLGAGVGLTRAALILCLLGTVILMTPLATADWWTHSLCAPWVIAALQLLKPALPASVSAWIAV
jgi:membrane protein required for colicin V production